MTTDTDVLSTDTKDREQRARRLAEGEKEVAM